jgi:hypothetical protein
MSRKRVSLIETVRRQLKRILKRREDRRALARGRGARELPRALASTPPLARSRGWTVHSRIYPQVTSES